MKKDAREFLQEKKNALTILLSASKQEFVKDCEDGWEDILGFMRTLRGLIQSSHLSSIPAHAQHYIPISFSSFLRSLFKCTKTLPSLVCCLFDVVML